MNLSTYAAPDIGVYSYLDAHGLVCTRYQDGNYWLHINLPGRVVALKISEQLAQDLHANAATLEPTV